MGNIIEITNLTKIFYAPGFPWQKKKPTTALSNVNLEIKEGQCFALLGPNGAGKTTLLKIISTLILPDKGTVTVNGYQTGNDDEKIKSQIGLVSSQERSFYWRLSGKQNLEFFAAMYGLDKKGTNARIKELFSLLQINHLEQDRRFGSYSTGMKQKFSLIRALLHEPRILLLDEPTKSLDYKTATDFRNFIRQGLVKRQRKTVIFTTHHMDEALDFGDYFLLLHKGRLFASGTLEELRKRINNPTASLGEIFLELTK